MWVKRVQPPKNKNKKQKKHRENITKKGDNEDKRTIRWVFLVGNFFGKVRNYRLKIPLVDKKQIPLVIWNWSKFQITKTNQLPLVIACSNSKTL